MWPLRLGNQVDLHLDERYYTLSVNTIIESNSKCQKCNLRDLGPVKEKKDSEGLMVKTQEPKVHVASVSEGDSDSCTSLYLPFAIVLSFPVEHTT